MPGTNPLGALEALSSWVLWILAMAVGVIGLVMICYAFLGNAFGRGPQRVMPGVVVVALLGFGGLMLFSVTQIPLGVGFSVDSTDDGATQETSTEPDPEPEPAPVPEAETGDTTDPVSIPWRWLGFAAVGLALGAGGFFAWIHVWSSANRAIERRRAERESRDRLRATYAAQWADLRDRGRQAVEGWLAYETDLSLLLRYPVMGDLTDPVVQRVVRDCAQVRTFLHRVEPADPDADVLSSPFGKAVENLELSLTAAQRHAVQVRDSRFSKDEQKRLRTAQHLLARALNVTNHPQERHLAYERVIKILDGLLPVPEKALGELAEKAGVTPALERSP